MGFVIAGGAAATKANVGAEASSPLHVSHRPLSHGALGHYRWSGRQAIIAAQAANSVLFGLRNTGGNLIIPTRCTLKLLQIAAMTAAIEVNVEVRKFTKVDAWATNQVNRNTEVARKRSSNMAAAPGSAEIMSNTSAGAAAGMSGGTAATFDTGAIRFVPLWALLAMPTAGPAPSVVDDNVFDDVNGTHPFALAQNEGIGIRNVNLLGAAAGLALYIDISWAEVAAF
jgi:hypothetical protein